MKTGFIGLGIMGRPMAKKSAQSRSGSDCNRSEQRGGKRCSGSRSTGGYIRGNRKGMWRCIYYGAKR
mgnify:CR=1 FL=1